MAESNDVVDFDAAKKRVEAARKEEKEKDLEKRFKKAIGWKEKSKFKAKTKVKTKVKVKKKNGANGPKPKKPSKPRGKGK